MKDYLDVVWRDHPEHIRRYYDLLPLNEKLCGEVVYLLKHILKNESVEYAHVTSRAKTLPSFCEKLNRKSYENPFSEITDLAGVRIVYLYASDIQRIETLIEREFEVVEKINKIQGQGSEKFGYSAFHYLVKIKTKQSGIRYEELKPLLCEIQVRTILQDAWALVAHHLSYKQEADIPQELRRKLNALSGLFETADDQFENIRHARIIYRDKVANEIKASPGVSLNEKINLDNLSAYVQWKFPDREEMDMENLSGLLSELKELGYQRMNQIDNVIEQTKDAVLLYEKEYPPRDEYDDHFTTYGGVGMIRVALKFARKDYRCHTPDFARKTQKYRHLLKTADG